MLPWCIALSAAAHVLLLAAAAPAAPRVGGLAARAVARSPSAAVSVRLVYEPRAPDTLAASSAADPPASAPSVPQLAPAVEMAAAPASAVASAGDASPAPMSAAPADGASDGDYLPRSLLTIAPIALTSVVIPTPPGTPAGGRRVGVLSLYIDEEGRVRRVEAEQPALPEIMERAAREAFSAARFQPGQVDGHVVKSRIRVEVVFDEEPAAAASGAASAASAAAAQRSP